MTETRKRLMVRILMPKIGPEDIESLKVDQKYMFRATLPVGSTFVGACAVPSLIDMLGFSGGGGVPALAFTIDPDCETTEDFLVMLSQPEEPFNLFPDAPKGGLGTFFVEGKMAMLDVLGVLQSMGMLLAAFRYTASCNPEILDVIQKGYEDVGVHFFEMQPYRIPDMLKVMGLQKISQAKAQVAGRK